VAQRQDESHRRSDRRGILALFLLLAMLPLAARGCAALLPQVRGMLPGGVGTTRLLAVVFLLCDLLISASLVALLILGDPLSVPREDRRLTIGGRGLWRVMLALAVLCYLALTPVFLMLYLRLR
jgi:hypothetical protein